MKVNLVNKNFQRDYLKNLLIARGVQEDTIEDYLHPTEKNLNDPILFENIDNGAVLLNSILNQEDSNILIVADADVDGYTSAAIIWLYIKAISPNQNLYYILHEHKEHGLEDLIDQILDDKIKYDLIILPDSSSNDYEYHERLNLPCLVLDHHELEKNQPISKNTVLINNQTSPDYPNKDLTGAGVVWQFCRYYSKKYGFSNDIVKDLTDLAALGICGDMGSVLNLENRYIMTNGFQHIKNYFFQCAFEKQSYSMNNMVTPISVAFYIVPLMNAMIRTGTQEEKERLFLGLIDGHRQVLCNKRGAKGTTEEVAIESLRECTNAKSKQDKIALQMTEELEQKIFKYDLLENKILFIRLDENDKEYPSEFTGLCAMKLASKYKKPTVLTRLGEDGLDKGSIRNVSNCELTDLKKFLNESGYFDWVQGHPNAAGCQIQDKKLYDFHQYANEALKDVNFNEGVYDINFIREANSADLENLIFELGSQTDVWGQNNNEPVIYVSNIKLNEVEYKVIGAKQDTLRIVLNNGITLIKFHANNMIEDLKNKQDIQLNVVGRPNINTWMGNSTAQLFIEDYEIVENDLFSF